MHEPSRDELLAIYANTTTIAVVGATNDESKPGNFIPRYLQSQGYRIVPVTPAHAEVLGEPTVASLSDLEVPVDVVDVFRPPREAPELARTAADIGAKVLWLQPGIVSAEAAAIAEAAGLSVVMDRCMGKTHGELGLGPGPG